MSLTLLLDLDDTLLDTNLEAFMPAYFQALSQHLANRAAPEVMLRALLSGVNLMNESEDPTRTLEEIFDADFYAKLGVSKAELIHIIEEFYDNIFPRLAQHTHQRPEAVPFVEWAFACGYRIAIATDPLFPRKATYHRLRWAGFEPERFDLVSTFEHFHFTKTHPAYYAEVLGRLGWPEGPVLMVGNDIARDLVPAQRLGLKTFFVDGESASSPGYEAGRGKLADLRPWLESTNLSTLEPSFKSREAVLAIMVSTPAVLRSLSSALTEQGWKHEPTRNDWAMNEIICHLRDMEREIHQLQLNLMMQREGAFLPRPDSAVWANEREYLNVDGKSALMEFASARIETLGILKGLEENIWTRSVRHAIFGPTNFLEAVSFMADHDRLHVQQAWKTLKSV
ncbi:MAG: HAD hydrolase-like protein [Anaerolineales bacterium]|nr:HAD hydrolase-like protein [Anaerolineales bacterium]